VEESWRIANEPIPIRKAKQQLDQGGIGELGGLQEFLHQIQRAKKAANRAVSRPSSAERAPSFESSSIQVRMISAS